MFCALKSVWVRGRKGIRGHKVNPWVRINALCYLVKKIFRTIELNIDLVLVNLLFSTLDTKTTVNYLLFFPNIVYNFSINTLNVNRIIISIRFYDSYQRTLKLEFFF